MFGSLAFLAFYRDWRVLVPATVVVAGGHLLRGMYFPESVYGVLVVSQWRWLEHAGWVIFEDIVLVSSCLRGTRELRDAAGRTAELELSEERHRAFFEGGVAGNYRTDTDGRVIACNDAFARLLGFESTQQALRPNAGSFYLSAEDRATFLQLLRERRSVTDFESVLRRHDGATVTVLDNAVATLNDQGTIVEVRSLPSAVK